MYILEKFVPIVNTSYVVHTLYIALDILYWSREKHRLTWYTYLDSHSTTPRDMQQIEHWIHGSDVVVLFVWKRMCIMYKSYEKYVL